MTMFRRYSAAALLALIPIASGAAPQIFETPQAALDAMVKAAQDQDRAGLLQVFGPEAEDLIYSGDEAEDSRNRQHILEMVAQGFRFVPQEDGAMVIDMGNDDWPFPIPLAKGGDGWSFDIAAGRQEMADREIGLNELEVMTLLAAYGELQTEFRASDRDGDGVMEFARSMISTPAARDGLYWPGDDESPLGEQIARASLDGFSDGSADQEGEPYDGYFFRILTAQGERAPGGAMSYLVNDNMVAGHAVLAVPAEYGVTGIHSFMMAENGIILQADLGEDSLNKGFAIESYDPDAAWTPAPPPEDAGG